MRPLQSKLLCAWKFPERLLNPAPSFTAKGRPDSMRFRQLLVDRDFNRNTTGNSTPARERPGSGGAKIAAGMAFFVG
jgi:hypothetical protein